MVTCPDDGVVRAPRLLRYSTTNRAVLPWVMLVGIAYGSRIDIPAPSIAGISVMVTDAPAGVDAEPLSAVSIPARNTSALVSVAASVTVTVGVGRMRGGWKRAC